MFVQSNACESTNRFPRREILKWAKLYPTALKSRSGAPPETETLHKPVSPSLSEMKTISRPSAVQSWSLIYRLSKVNRLGSPPLAAMREMSSTPWPLMRLKASWLPSGEKTGLLSPTDPAGGEVSLRFSPVSVEIRTMLKGSAAEFLSGTARNFPSNEYVSPSPPALK